MTANEQMASVGKNIQEKATLIWNVANTLFGAFKPHEYGLVILKSVMENGEELLSTLDDDEEVETIYNLFMERFFEEEEDN